MKIKYEKEFEVNITDILVVGGGPAGIAAAISSARNGSQVMMVEKSGCLGGLGTNGLVPAFAPLDDGKRVLADGIAKEVVTRLEKRGGVTSRLRDGNLLYNDDDSWLWTQYDFEQLKILYDDMVSESQVELKFFTNFIEAIRKGNSIEAVLLSGPQGVYAVKAQVYIDTTGDGVLSASAGVPYELGDENGEVQGLSLCSCFTNVDWNKYESFLKKSKQTVNLKKSLKKAIDDGAFSQDDYHLPGARRVGQRIAGMNVGHIYGTDPITNVTTAMIKGRKIAYEFLSFYRNYVHGFEEAELAYTAPLLGVRESRRIIGEYFLNVEDYKARRSFDDEIGRYNYPIDMHRSKPGKEEFEVLEKEYYGLYRYKKGESYGIPYRCLIAKGMTNLLMAGRCISTDRKVQASTRVQPCCFITGQAVGTAAALSLNDNIDVNKINIEKLQNQLRKDGAYIPV